MSELSLTKATTGIPQLSSSSITTNGSTAGAGPPGTVVVAGSLAVGGVVSSTIIVCETVAVLPQASVYVHVLVIVSGQLFPSDTSVPVTVPAPSQLSVQPRSTIAGTSPTHSTVTSAGNPVITGAVLSSTVIVCVAVATLPQASVYVQVLVIVPPQVPPVNAPSFPDTVPLPSQLSVHERFAIAGTSEAVQLRWQRNSIWK